MTNTLRNSKSYLSFKRAVDEVGGRTYHRIGDYSVKYKVNEEVWSPIARQLGNRIQNIVGAQIQEDTL